MPRDVAEPRCCEHSSATRQEGNSVSQYQKTDLMGDLKEQEMDSALVSPKKHGPAEFEHLTLPVSPLPFCHQMSSLCQVDECAPKPQR